MFYLLQGTPCHPARNKSISTDSELRQLVRTFSQQIPTTDVIVSVEDVLNAAIIKTTVLVGEELLSNHATLLPSVQDSFSRYVHEFLMATNLESEGGEVNPLVPSRWILSNLTANLKHHMSYTCRAHKYGTLLYRTNSDLLSIGNVQKGANASTVQTLHFWHRLVKRQNYQNLH